MFTIAVKSTFSIFYLALLGSLCLYLIIYQEGGAQERRMVWGLSLVFYLFWSMLQEFMVLAMFYKNTANALTGLGSVVLSIALNIIGFIYLTLFIALLVKKDQSFTELEKAFAILFILWIAGPINSFVLCRLRQIYRRLSLKNRALARKKLLLMTWNIQRGLNFSWKYELDRALQYILEIDPDILCLQEADTPHDFAKIQKLADDLKAKLIQDAKKSEGLIILSKYPVEKTDVLYFDSEPSGETCIDSSYSDMVHASNCAAEKEYLLSALITIDGFTNKKIWISVTHTDSHWNLAPASRQILQAFHHIQKLDPHNGLVVKTLIGDLNMPASAQIHKILQQSMIDCWNFSGSGLLGWTASIGSLGRKLTALAHNVRLDYVYMDKPKGEDTDFLILGRTNLGASFLSDHRALIVELFY